MREKLIKLGHIKTVILISIIAIVSSVFLYSIVSYILITEDFFKGLLIAIIIPSIIAPTISWYIIKLFIKIHYLEIEMRKLATFDSLTNVMSRQAFISEAQKVYNFNQQKRISFAILYVDIDNFKSINDNYGHSMGDKVLANFGSLLNKITQDRYLVGRIGGEEFALILNQIDLKNTINFSTNLLKSVNKESIKENQNIIKYTVSIGISIFNDKNRVPLDTLMKQSDKALYSAKKSGKNCYKAYLK